MSDYIGLTERRERDEKYMRAAIDAAKAAEELKEVPIGAVVVCGDEIIAAGYNTRETQKNGLHHAEIIAIDNACKTLGSWRLENCELYVTLEPCPMCAGAVINSRIGRVVFGAYDKKAGSCGSVVNLFALGYNHTPIVSGGVLKEECAQLLSDFFKKLR
ncbi:MAG: tRNA adenosine(34) deaminase TadA [Clostridia bacterium]|nr:tRNA adenosine(34) deaminase TadA [Clostridia bacterium]